LKRQDHERREIAEDQRLGISTYTPAPKYPPSSTDTHFKYEALSYRSILEMEKRLALNEQDLLCDAGCGMGRIVCYFAQHPLKACIGLEYDPALADLARRNIASLRHRRSPTTIITGDAATHDYGEVTALTMYNPFGAAILHTVLGNLAASLATNPRRVQVVYANPAHKAVFDDFPVFREREHFTVPYLDGRMGVTFWETKSATAA
jgi:cyclopropane fatty-acyl-phospholipid synthase-like methyltransferase